MARIPKADRKQPPAIRRGLDDTSNHLRAWRKLRGLTQAQLANRAGVAVNTLRSLEGGDGSVSLENTMRVLRALGILGTFATALDPYESDVGRLRSEELLPERVRPRRLS